eukprot:SAG31_NODE_800_length_12014_cov_11.050608_8_plen_294_part_00
MPPPDLITTTDASTTGAGITIARDSPSHIHHPFDGRWHFSPSERRHHITWKETSAPLPGIKALDLSLRVAHKPALRNIVWLNRTDNTVGNTYVNRMGGRKTHLMRLARKQWHWCLKRNILPISEYMEGDSMISSGADLQSRLLYSRAEWKIKDRWFQLIDRTFGPHTIDAFASSINHVLPRFYSRFNQHQALGRDALHQDPSGENWFCNPPHVMIPHLLRHMQQYSVHWTLVTRQPPDFFTPLLIERSIQPPILIEDPEMMRPVVVDRRATQHKTYWNFMAWRLSTRPANGTA